MEQRFQKQDLKPISMIVAWVDWNLFARNDFDCKLE